MLMFVNRNYVQTCQTGYLKSINDILGDANADNDMLYWYTWNETCISIKEI